jgi:hypothetical protein
LAICAGFLPILSATAFTSGASAAAVVPIDVVVLVSSEVGVVDPLVVLPDLPREVDAVVAAGFFVEACPAPVDLPDPVEVPPAFGPCVAVPPAFGAVVTCGAFGAPAPAPLP